MTHESYLRWSRITALSLKFVGILGIIFITAFWAFTDRLETPFLPFFATLAGVGQGLDLLREIRLRQMEGEKDAN